jgi:putative DNA primase/helicase
MKPELESLMNNAKPQIYEPEPLRAPLPKAEPYPVAALGEVLGAAAIALNETIKAPLTLCCQSVLASASLAAQAHFDVMLPWGQKKPLSLFLLTVAESGERKSGVDDVVLGAAKAQERQEMEAYAIEQKCYEAEFVQWKEVSDAANKAVAKASKSQAASDYAAEAKYSCPDKPEAPIMPLRFVTEPTVEGLYKLMMASQPSIGLFSDEGGLLIGGHTLNSDNALKTMARWCKLWDGAAFDRVRAGDGSGVLYGRRLAMHQLAQPEVMALLLGDRMANGQGLLARCLVAWPESTIGKRHIASFEQPKERQEVKRLFAHLQILTEAAPRTGSSEQELDPIELPLSDAAKQMAINAMNHFETLMQAGNDLSELRDRASKALENACRIAGVLTAIEDGMSARSIDAERLGRALDMIDWYLKETLRIKGAAVVPQSVTDAESLSRWLDMSGYQAFRTHQVLNKGPSQLRNKKRLDGAISVLVANGYLVENEPGRVIEGVVTKKSWSVQHVVSS